MLDKSGKLIERLLKPRFTAAIENGDGLFARQYGFRPSHSTIGTLREVTKAAIFTQRGSHCSPLMMQIPQFASVDDGRAIALY